MKNKTDRLGMKPKPVQEPSNQRTKFLGDLRESPAASAPPTPAGHRTQADVPAVAVPARVQDPDGAVLVHDIPDVGVAVDEKRTLLTLALRLQHVVVLPDADKALGLRTHCNHDVRIMRRPTECVHTELTGGHVLFNATEQLWNPLVDIAELHFGVTHRERLLCDEPPADQRHIALELEQGTGIVGGTINEHEL